MEKSYGVIVMKIWEEVLDRYMRERTPFIIPTPGKEMGEWGGISHTLSL